ncbi:MAG: formimidoylglutamate deiminase [Acidobacteriota bacterium]|nr:formimidoylglutamate deiminase [Acidobacteriota bacterium]
MFNPNALDLTPQDTESGSIAWLPDLLYVAGRFERDLALVCGRDGRITKITSDVEGVGRVVRLPRRAMLPGLVNAHSHAFQRVIRGRTEYRSAVSPRDSFWTWRDVMYSAAARLTPDDIYDASRMAFLEMASGGITAVGEFHYLHHAPDGRPYNDPNLLAKQVIRAARDVGLRIALLRVAYARAGFQQLPDARQARFIEPDPQTYLRHVDELQNHLMRDDEGRHDEGAWVGVAPHSVRAVPLDFLREVGAFADERQLPFHMHVAEQPAEVSACVAEHGRAPIALLADKGLLNARFTGVHAIHVTSGEISALSAARARICACPTTERNLGDGIIPADRFFAANVPIALGTDSHTQIDLLEDARELEYHLRLQKLERNILASPIEPNISSSDGDDDSNDDEKRAAETMSISALAARLFDCATIHGAASIGAPGGELTVGHPADFFTVSLDDSSIAGASRDDLLATILFSLARTAVRDVVVGGHIIIDDTRHHQSSEIVERFAALQQRVWGKR